MEPRDLDSQIARAVRGMAGAAPVPPALDDLSPAIAVRRRRARRLVVAGTASCLVLAVGGIAVALSTGGATDRRVQVAPADTPPADCVVAPTTASPPPPGFADATWSELPPSPLGPRSQASYVWTGTDVIVFGGEVIAEGATDGPRRNDGAAYDPATGTWRAIADAPIEARSDQHAVWTGSEMLVVGGNEESLAGLTDGAAYDPVTDTWRTIADPPLDGLRNSVAAWTGTDLVVWDSVHGGARYDPCGDEWTPMAPAPDGFLQDAAYGTASAWTGAELIVWGGATGTNFPLDAAAAYDPAADTWRSIPAPSRGAVYDADPVWSGNELLVWGRSNLFGPPRDEIGMAYDPRTDTWRDLPPAPLDRADQGEGSTFPRQVWAGDRLVAWTGNLDLAGPLPLSYDPGTDAWTRLTPAPAGAGDLSYVGTRVDRPPAARVPRGSRWRGRARCAVTGVRRPALRTRGGWPRSPRPARRRRARPAGGTGRPPRRRATRGTSRSSTSRRPPHRRRRRCR